MMLVGSRIYSYVAIAALTAAGLLAVASPATGAATVAPGSCAPTPEARRLSLVVAPGSLAAGQTVHFRIDNSTASAITYGPGYSIQECVAGVWMLAPFSPLGEARVKILQRPGRGRWQGAPTPTTAAAGEYRIRKSIAVGRRGRWIYGDFAIAT